MLHAGAHHGVARSLSTFASGQAVDACLNVAGYLHSRSKPGWGIFSLRESRSNGSTSNAAATFALARQ
eukprot:scaffold2116_cov23-Tisochrysis_lutea.AAC.1